MRSARGDVERQISHLHPAFYCVDAKGSITFISRSAAKLTGLDHGMVLSSASEDGSPTSTLAWATYVDRGSVLPTNQFGGRLVVLRARPGTPRAELVTAELAGPSSGDLAPWIAHELRTPLTCVIGAAELLHESLAARVSPEELVLLNSLMRNSERLAKRIDEAILYATDMSLRCHGPAD